jgi:cytosine/adenosine deaminase-related metal-dependent hydrolase
LIHGTESTFNRKSKTAESAGTSMVPADFFCAYPFRHAFAGPEGYRSDGYLVVRGGRFLGIRAKPPRGARVAELRGDTIIPGLVNAHAHLRFSHLGGFLPAGSSFVSWIEGVLGAPRPALRDAVAGARRMRAAGTTCVGDFDPDGLGAGAMAAAGLRGVAYREFFSFDPATACDDARAASRAVAETVNKQKTRARIAAGLAPHAPYTVAEPAFRAMGRGRIALHFMETPEERRWVERGEGPIERLLRARGRRPPMPVPACSPVTYLERNGLLRKGVLLVHANACTSRELVKLASSGAVLVHCPGTHAFFRRGTPPVYEWIRAGVPFALGTDSLASSDTLDLCEEAARLSAADARLDPGKILEAVTYRAGRALGLAGAGTLSPGAPADFVVLEGADTPTRSASAARRALAEYAVSRPKVVEVCTAAYVK